MILCGSDTAEMQRNESRFELAMSSSAHGYGQNSGDMLPDTNTSSHGLYLDESYPTQSRV